MMDALLTTLNECPQFIVRKGKIPFDPGTMEPGDPHNPAMWMDAETAMTTASLLGADYGIGFVLTAADPFWCIDIDHCLIDGAWSPLANEMMTLMAGCAIEVSMSGEGLHLFGKGKAPDHSMKNISLGMEFYTELRYIALTGNPTTGDAGVDLTHILPHLVNTWFPAHAAADAVEWTTEPCAEWSGPVDDDILIAKAIGTTSAAAAFGVKTSMKQLWDGDAGGISLSYPDGERDYDASSADAALAQHLAFWTGKDCARIERLMLKSGLVRDKWTRRENGPGYLKTTILRAVAQQDAVYSNSRQPPPPKSPPKSPSAGSAPPPPGAGPGRRTGFQFMATDMQQEYFKGCVYVQQEHRIFTPNGSLMKPEQFKVMYAGYTFSLDDTNEKTTRSAWEVFYESQAINWPKVTSTCFRPELPSGCIITEEGRQLVNVYVPVITRRVPGTPQRFIDFMHRLMPNQIDRDIVLAYMAALVQYPGVKFQWCPLVQGMEGNGKSLLIRCLSYAIGERYTHLPNASDLGGNGQKFNAWLAYKLFIGVEEIYTADRAEVSEALKTLITNSRVEIQGKGQDQVTGDNRANFFMCTNHKDALRITLDTRRYAPIYTAQQNIADMRRDGLTDDYFAGIYDWLRADGYAQVNDYLREYAIPDALNPATLCQRAPTTSSSTEATTLSMGAVEQEIIEAIEQEFTGFSGGWVSSLMLDRLLDDIRAKQKIPRNRRRAVMQGLGYDYHPALVNGRINNKLPIEQGKPYLYIKNGHIGCNITVAAEVLKAYCKAQGYVDNIASAGIG